MTDDDLTQQIIGCAYKVHNTLGSGFLEKVYENALRIELEKQGRIVREQLSSDDEGVAKALRRDAEINANLDKSVTLAELDSQIQNRRG
jgi:GxxExxY protein